MMMLNCDPSTHSLNMYPPQLRQETNETTKSDRVRLCSARLYISLTPGCQCILSSSVLCPSHSLTARLGGANMALLSVGVMCCCPQRRVLSTPTSVSLYLRILQSSHVAGMWKCLSSSEAEEVLILQGSRTPDPLQHENQCL